MKKYILEVLELEEKPTKQVEKERAGSYSNYQGDAYAGYNGFNTLRVLKVELSSDEFSRLKASVFKEI